MHLESSVQSSVQMAWCLPRMIRTTIIMLMDLAQKATKGHGGTMAALNVV